MHYIRFLKVPVFRNLDNGTREVTSKITVCTDLGDAFLLKDIQLVAEVIDEDDRVHPRHRRTVTWTGNGMRALDVTIPLAPGIIHGPVRLAIQAVQDEYNPRAMRDFLDLPPRQPHESAGFVLRVESDAFGSATTNIDRRVERELALDAEGDTLVIYEETGESIARHIWDAGLILSAYISSLTQTKTRHSRADLPLFRQLLTKKDGFWCIELGCGVGIVGATIAACFQHARVILTDLPSAANLAKLNIRETVSVGGLSASKRGVMVYQNCDWEAPPADVIECTRFDLIIAADVTYNPDVVPHLVDTIAELAQHSTQALICVAMKVRHEAEAVFFGLMQQAHLVMIGKMKLPLPVLGGADQEIEVYLFHLSEASMLGNR